MDREESAKCSEEGHGLVEGLEEGADRFGEEAGAGPVDG